MKSSKKLLAILMLVLILASVLTIAVFADGDSGSSAVTHITCTTCEGTGEFNGDECGECGGTGVLESDSYMAFTFWALVPPLVAIILALITKEVYSSLFIGVLLGSLFYSNWGPVKALDATINDGLIASISDNAGIFLFLVILIVLLAEAVDAIERFWGEKALVWDSEGMEEVFQLIQTLAIRID